jgi:hypothetical protein
MDRAGNIGLGFSVSGPDRHPAIAWTGRAQADPPGVMAQGETIAFTGAGSLAGTLRWGDYSSLSVDPADECTFWYTNQYIPAPGAQNWHTRILTFQMPGCTEAPDYTIWITPERQTIGRGRNTTFTIATAALRRSAAATPLALTISGLPPSLTAALEQSTLFPGQKTILTISAVADAAFEVVPFSLQGTAGSTSQTRTAEVAVVANDFSLSLDPAEATVAADLTTNVLLKTSVLFGSPDLLLFTVGHLRKGVTAAIEPPRINAGETATLHLTGANDLSASEGRMTIVAESSVASHAIRARVRALGAPRAQISWPLPRTYMTGVEKIIASAVASQGTTLASIDLYADGKRQQGVSSSHSPAELVWDSRRIGDGMHQLAVRATDAVGGTGDSAPVVVWVQNKGDCGCSSYGGGWETLGLLGLPRRAPPPRKKIKKIIFFVLVSKWTECPESGSQNGTKESFVRPLTRVSAGASGGRCTTRPRPASSVGGANCPPLSGARSGRASAGGRSTRWMSSSTASSSPRSSPSGT